jgi:hypothetical protein
LRRKLLRKMLGNKRLSQAAEKLEIRIRVSP